MQKITQETQDVLDIKHRLQVADNELTRLRGTYTIYSRRILKFGMACWIFGISLFLLSVLIINAQTLATAYNIYTPLMLIALAIPFALTAMLIRKLINKIRYAERVRRTLIDRYSNALLKHVEKLVMEDTE